MLFTDGWNDDCLWAFNRIHLLRLSNQYLQEEEKEIQLGHATARTVKERQADIEEWGSPSAVDRREERGMEGQSGNKTRSVDGEDKGAGADGGCRVNE